MPILDSNSLEVISRSPEQTRRVGMRLGSLLRCGDVVCLEGELGAGKTTLMQGIANGWGSLDQASSPTFVLVNVYRRSEHQRLYHLDAYRLDGSSEAEELDLVNMIENGPLVIEWAERIWSALPDENLWVKLRWISDEQRDLTFAAHGQRYHELLFAMRKQVFGG